MYLQTLTDEELLRYAEQTMDALTTSDLERELILRLRATVDAEEEGEDPRLTLLDEAGFDDEAGLEKFLSRVNEIRDLAGSL